MRITLLLTIGILAVLNSHANANDAIISMPTGAYEAYEFNGKFKIDGKLDEAGWKKLNENKRFYAFSTPGRGEAPQSPKIKTSFRCGFNKDGILLAITCFDKNMKTIREKIVTRDDGSLWTDDCVEIYIAPLPRKTLEFRKFIVNALGTRYDGVNPAGGAIDGTWNDNNWQVATAKLADRWVIELFFPWKTLGMKKAPDRGIALGLCRFAWGSGKFQGASWGPGMGFPFVERCGSVYFGRGFLSKIKEAAPELNHIYGPSWYIESNSGIIKYTDKKAAIDGEVLKFEKKKKDVEFLVGLLKNKKAANAFKEKLAKLAIDPKSAGKFKKNNDYAGMRADAYAKMRKLNKIYNEIRIRLLMGK